MELQSEDRPLGDAVGDPGVEGHRFTAWNDARDEVRLIESLGEIGVSHIAVMQNAWIVRQDLRPWIQVSARKTWGRIAYW